MVASQYGYHRQAKHKRTSNGPKPRHSAGWLSNFFASFSKPTPSTYGGRHRNDRQANHRRGVGSM